MRLTAAVCAAVVLSACAQPDPIKLDDIRDARGDLPGFTTVINCSRAPRIVYDKFGEIIDTIHPVRHPSCAEKENEAQRQAERSQLRRGTQNISPFNVADDNDPPRPTVAALEPDETDHHHDDDHPDHDHTHDHPHDGNRPTERVSPSLPAGCIDPDSCHEHPLHNPALHDNAHERRTIHGLAG